jgi:hypothetical protein
LGALFFSFGWSSSSAPAAVEGGAPQVVAVLQFRRVFLASSLVGAGWCLPHSALAFGCVPLVGLLLRLFTASYSFFPSGGVSVLLLYVCSLHLLGVFSSSCSIA